MIEKNLKALDTFMKVLRKEMNKTEASLQVEESGSKIAYLQGKCAGFRSLCKILVESGYNDYTSNTETIDLKAMQEKEPKLYDELLADYKKVTNKKAYVRITVK